MPTLVTFLAVNTQSALELWRGAKDWAIDDLGVNWYGSNPQVTITSVVNSKELQGVMRPQILIVDFQHPGAEEVVKHFRRCRPRPFLIGVTRAPLTEPNGLDAVCYWGSRDELASALKEGLEQSRCQPVPF
ncbi:MAG: hypothetical protein WC518_03600 [Patescibacteria group bacterium]